MRRRNILYSSQMIAYQTDLQSSSHLLPDPCVIVGSVPNVPQASVHAIAASGSTTSFDVHHLPEHFGSAIYYGMMPHNVVHHHQPAVNLDLGVTAAPNYYNSYMIPSSASGTFPHSLNHRSSEQMPSTSNHGVNGGSRDDFGRNVPSSEHERNDYFLDAERASCKRKNAEGFPGNIQYINPSASSSSSVAPFNMSHPEFGVPVTDAESSAPLQYRGTGSLVIVDQRSHRSVRNRSGAIGVEPITSHNQNHLVHGNYMGASQTPCSPWMDQQQHGSGGDISASAWNQAPAVTYLHGRNVNGASVETGNVCLQGYHEMASNRGPTTYAHPPPIHLPQHSFHHSLPSLMHGVRGQNINYYPQMAASPYRFSVNNASHSMVNPSQDGVETMPRHLGSVPPTGIRIYRPHRGGAVPETTSRHRNLPYLRVLPSEEIAMLEIPDFYEVGSHIDHHRDMRLDIEHMSYEELLALGEQIGNVNTGLSEETITSHMKTRIYSSSAPYINLEEEPCMDQESDVCIICQCDYENRDKIGSLNCGHEYHADCLKKWLLVKNVCPICKSSGLASEEKDA